MVVEGELSVMGGNSGISSNYSDYCGDGGGGGVILIRALDIRFSNLSTVHHSGGRGLENGSIGLFDPMCMYLLAAFPMIMIYGIHKRSCRLPFCYPPPTRF